MNLATTILPVLRAARPKFLTLPILSVLIGIGAAKQSHIAIDATDSVLVMLGAVLALASVNLLNEVEDFRCGLDLLTQRTPFSGGSGSLPQHPEAAAAARHAGLACLLACALIGLYFVASRGWGLLLPGVLGLAIVVSYTTVLTRRPLLCLLAPGLGIGPLMVAGTSYALGAGYSPAAMTASLPPMFLASALLLLNQFPDADADRRVGRRHLVIALGERRSAEIFAWLWVACEFAIAAGVVTKLLAPLCGLALLATPFAVLLVRRVRRHADDLPRLLPWLGANVALMHATLLLFALGLLFTRA